MPLYEVSEEQLTELPVEKFAALNMYERDDLQRLLRNDISPLGDDLLVISEEYGQWEDARRRIDLLALDTAGRLVVIELKRTEAGGHMDLQAIRYAAMVSTLSFEDVVNAFHGFLAKHRPDEAADARATLEAFLGLEDADEEPTISTQVRIHLVSANFGRELTTAVLWLNSFEGMDVRCFRLIPYDLDGRIVLDVQQVIPLPEAADYQIRVRHKEAARERARTQGTDGRDLTKYQIVVDGQPLPPESKRQAIRLMIETLADRGVPPSAINDIMPERGMRELPGLFLEESDVRRELAKLVSSADQVRRHFTDRPLVDPASGRTYVIYKMWGLNTEETLRSLADAFPDSGVTFRAASEATPTS